MKAQVWIEEIEDYVEFTATLVSVNGRSIDYLNSYPFQVKPKTIEIENVSWDNECYTHSENQIIQKYIWAASDALIENFHEEMLEVNP